MAGTPSERRLPTTPAILGFQTGANLIPQGNPRDITIVPGLNTVHLDKAFPVEMGTVYSFGIKSTSGWLCIGFDSANPHAGGTAIIDNAPQAPLDLVFTLEIVSDIAAVPGGPPLALVLDPVRPNPSRGGALTVRFTLPTAAPARVELLDVSGRRIASREVGAGRHTLDLGQGQHLAPGLYLVRLTQGANTRVTRTVVLR